MCGRYRCVRQTGGLTPEKTTCLPTGFRLGRVSGRKVWLSMIIDPRVNVIVERLPSDLFLVRGVKVYIDFVPVSPSVIGISIPIKRKEDLDLRLHW